MRSAGRRALAYSPIGMLVVVATPFGPEEGWFGVDVGPAGASRSILALGAAIGLLAARGDQLFPDRMPVAQRVPGLARYSWPSPC
jgi:hypothetical protein